jgi:bacterioferritin B
MALAPAFVDQLDEQIAYEFAAEHQYIACAVHYDSEALPELARFFYRQALEERGHAMMMVQFLLDAGEKVEIAGVAAPRSSFANLVEPISLAHEQERRVTDQINALAAIAREAGDYTSEQFIQWFIREQIEEVATMRRLLRVAQRSLDDPSAIEDFVAREHAGGDAEDPTAPRAAGPV